MALASFFGTVLKIHDNIAAVPETPEPFNSLFRARNEVQILTPHKIWVGWSKPEGQGHISYPEIKGRWLNHFFDFRGGEVFLLVK